MIVLFFTCSLLPSLPSYTAIKAFSKMINEVNDLAGQRELISEYLESEVCVWRVVGGSMDWETFSKGQ